MFRSIRWTLFFWYALILLGALGAFGGTLYRKLEVSSAQEVDAELRAHAQAMAGALEFEEGAFELELSSEYVRFFRGSGEDAPYYILWDGRGKVIDRSKPRLEIDRPEGPGTRERGYAREIAIAGPAGSLVLVGRGTHERAARLREFLWQLLGAGGAVLVLALAGGWFLATRALAPIARISEASAAISASDLSRRIDVEGVESELGRLARLLNSTFDRLQEAFERQTRFTADASHELRTPLAILLSHVELALRRERTVEEYREALETGHRAALRMKAVIDGLLTLARADSGKEELQRAPLDLGEVVVETALLLAPQAEARKISVAVAAEKVPIAGDRERLREVVTNLVSNAIRYNRDGGRVDVGLRSEDGAAVLSVADTGVGIPEKDQPHLFERFYRVDKARSRELGGVGLGLAITKWIVEAHGGRISLSSREGEGTTFTVEIPRGPAGTISGPASENG
ncbi:MAG: HAMP domain-containing protein [Planctomycetes bacterium]|nr:HAMP domain-containing protein [Planctomycetota bacterium]